MLDETHPNKSATSPGWIVANKLPRLSSAEEANRPFAKLRPQTVTLQSQSLAAQAYRGVNAKNNPPFSVSLAALAERLQRLVIAVMQSATSRTANFLHCFSFSPSVYPTTVFFFLFLLGNGNDPSNFVLTPNKNAVCSGGRAMLRAQISMNSFVPQTLNAWLKQKKYSYANDRCMRKKNLFQFKWSWQILLSRS